MRARARRHCLGCQPSPLGDRLQRCQPARRGGQRTGGLSRQRNFGAVAKKGRLGVRRRSDVSLHARLSRATQACRAMMYDALIVGAGPAGSTAARVLARAGWSVGLIEKSSFPRRKVCGEFISATSLPLLTDPAIEREFLAHAGPEIRRVGLFTRDVVLSSPMPRARNSAGSWGRALGRDKLDSVLLDAAVRAGAKLWQPWKLAALRKDAEG